MAHQGVTILYASFLARDDLYSSKVEQFIQSASEFIGLFMVVILQQFLVYSDNDE